MTAPPMDTTQFGPNTARIVRKFFGTEATPLVSLQGPAQDWGLAGVYVKDESKRLGQEAFKVFGGAFAMGCLLAKKLDVPIGQCGGLEGLADLYAKRFPNTPTTFVTCTDGNHGRGVAWAAKQLGQKAVVYMPKGSADARVKHIQGHGGTCTVTDMNYDATVEFAARQAVENHWIYLQDTTGPDYYEVPTWIMHGYTAMIDEALEQIRALGQDLPTHMILQVGVGSMAGAVLGYLVEYFKAEGRQMPIVLVLEPENAACAFASASKGDGSTIDVEGDLDSMIAGLRCGVLSDIGWPILWQHVDGAFATLKDGIAGNGMRLLAREHVVAGECGGAAPGLLQRIMAPGCPKAAELRRGLSLSADSRVLMINTEGATDPANYRKQLDLKDDPPQLDDFEFVLRRKTALRSAL